jgi:crotonobetainyl-CoA:carnitine CoA-transferase CaiB-like acyl-CoA transferase
MAPHGVYPAAGDDSWVAIACRDDDDWQRLGRVIDQPWARDDTLAALADRLDRRHELDAQLGAWTRGYDRKALQDLLLAAGVPAAQVATPEDRIDNDPRTERWGLWPTVRHTELGETRVEGIPLHLSETDWAMTRGAPCLGEDNNFVYGTLLGLSEDERADLAARGVI